MKKQSRLREVKRSAMREGGVTFADRVREAVRTGKPVVPVKYDIENKRLVAKT